MSWSEYEKIDESKEEATNEELKGIAKKIGLEDYITKRPKVLKNSLSKEEKIKILHSKRIDSKVVEYLKEKFKCLFIEVLGKYEGSLFELMVSGELEGWCWQTTESAVVFLNDDDYIERGNLYFDELTPKYYHSWICFKYNGTEYVLDPCLSILCKKQDYSKIFETDVKAKVAAKEVEEELVRQITTPKYEENSEEYINFDNFMKKILGDSYEKIRNKKKNEVIAHGPEDVNTPLYRNGAGYKAELENGKIKKIVVHYYYMDC